MNETMMMLDGVETPAPAGLLHVTATGQQVPFMVTNFQTRALLGQMPSRSGVEGRTLFMDVDDYMRATGGDAFQAWEYNNNVHRDSAMVAGLGVMLSLDGAQLDQMFIAANGISA